ncbi:hypothetical protein ACE41H_00405 [Paenibacillus enshidis]|uniref:Uncharacterized protein n=1 Tax=Paenibacillus enshidis TaxID=1458439 RepID=A0ABV5AM82_9BACL
MSVMEVFAWECLKDIDLLRRPSFLKFEVLEMDKVIAKVTVNYTGKKVDVWQDKEVDPIFLPFPTKETITLSDVVDYFESRCFPRTRHHADKLLKTLGLSEYDPNEIVKKTHGVLYDDYVWLRFEGEELTCKDVHPRYARERE